MTTSAYNPNQFQSGPAGFLNGAMLSLVELYAQLMESQQESAKQQIQVASQMATATAIADVEGAKDTAWATRSQAIGSAVSAGLTVAQAGATIGMSKTINAQLDTSNEQLNNLQKLNTQLKAASLKTAPLEAGPAPAEDTPIGQRIKEIAAGNHEATQIAGAAQPNGTTFLDHINEQATNAMSPAKAQAALEISEKQIAAKQDAIQSLHSQLSAVQSKIQMYQQGAKNVTDTFVGIGQAGWQAKSGVEQGNQALASVTQQLSSSMLENNRSNNNTYYGMIASVLQALRAASNTSGGG